MNDEELRDYLKRFCFGREHLICSRDLVRQKNLRESDLRKKVKRLRRKAVPIASSREGYFYASNAAELYSTIRQLKEMRADLDVILVVLIHDAPPCCLYFTRDAYSIRRYILRKYADYVVFWRKSW